MDKSSQVSVWVPLLVAAVGLIGVLISQAFSVRQRRFDHREQRRVSNLAWHREQRVNVYAELITAIDKAQEVLWSIRVQDISPDSPENRYREIIDSIDEREKAIKSSMIRAELFGSDDSVIQGADFSILMLDLAMNSMKLHVRDVSVEDWKNWYAAASKEFSNKRGELVNQMRTDLEIYN